MKTKRANKYKVLFIISGIIIIIFGLYVYGKIEGYHIIQGKITTSFLDMNYEDGTFLINSENSLYIDPSLNIDSVKEKFKISVNEEDTVLVVCKMSSHETAPKAIKIYFIIKV